MESNITSRAIMKSTRSTVCAIAVCLLLASLNVNAQPADQDSRARGPGGPNPMQHMTEALQLNESQSAQFQVIMTSAREQHEALGRENQEGHCAIESEVQLQLIEILNTDQLVSLEALNSERKSQPNKRGGPGPQDCE